MWIKYNKNKKKTKQKKLTWTTYSAFVFLSCEILGVDSQS